MPALFFPHPAHDHSAPVSRRRFLRGAALAGVSGLLARRDLVGAATSSNDGFRPLFDGATLKGWRPIPRLTVSKAVEKENLPAEKLRTRVVETYEAKAELRPRLAHAGRWEVVDGAIVGGQEPAGSGLGAYLLSEETFGDFELELEGRPDFPVDTGVVIRAHEIGSVGFQVLFDHRPNGGMGGVFGNGLGNFLVAPFSIDGDEAPGFRIANLRPGAGEPNFAHPVPTYGAGFGDFRRSWQMNDWNRLRIRCVGELPVITTWINDQKICEIDTATIRAPGYDPARVRALLGRAGHIAFEVHDNGAMGHNRWAEGAVCRWRKIRIKTL